MMKNLHECIFLYLHVCVVEASPVENFLRAERGSVNSHKSFKVTSAVHLGQQVIPGYRTCSHAGFPGGSYTIPNPTHFHVARQTQIAKMRPLLITLPPHTTSSNFTYNRGQAKQSTITLNLGSHSVAINIPVEVLKGFIYPFATALNFQSVPQLNNQGCQTSYMNNFDRKRPTDSDFSKVQYTPLYIDSYQTCHFQPEPTQSFEKHILDEMQQNLLADFYPSFSESESESIKTVKSEESESEMRNFTEQDEENSNESLIEPPADVTAMLPTSSTSSESLKNNFTEEASSDDFNTVKDAVAVAENFVEKLLDISITSANYLLLEHVLNETKSMLHQEAPHSANTTFSIDEGIEDCTLTNNTTLKCSIIIDDDIKKIGNVIFDYLVQHCFEVQELILFPEVLHDFSTNKLMQKLKEAFEECYGSSLCDGEKNELRISIASYVLKLLEIDDRLKDTSQDSCRSIVSDKIFTISEFLSDILDHFFNSLDTPVVGPFLDFENHMHGNNGSVCHSTPEADKKKKEVADEEIKDVDVTEEVTSFKKDTKPGSEIYWITLYDSPRREDSSERLCIPKKPILNIDDIPLRPPDDFELNYGNRILSPILEEPRVNLFDSHINDDKFEDASSNPLKEMDYNILNESKDSNKLDEVLSDETNTYFSFDECDTNVIINNEVNFYRVKTLTSSSYVQVKDAEFDQNDNSDKENESPTGPFEGNWMGYETAKF